MKKLTQHFHYLLALLGVIVLFSGLGHASDNQIRIPLSPLPKIVLPAPPPMIWLPTPKIFVAHKSPYPIFFHSGQYYLHDQDNWYIGPGYAGPWNRVHHKKVPKNLRAFRKDNWGQYQSEAAQHFRSDRHEHEHEPFYARREAREQHRRAYWQENEDQHDHERHERKEKKEKKEKRGKHDHDD